VNWQAIATEFGNRKLTRGEAWCRRKTATR
jgi:hypothetical protein